MAIQISYVIKRIILSPYGVRIVQPVLPQSSSMKGQRDNYDTWDDEKAC